MKKTLLCASIAYDSIMVFSGRFKDHILPDQVHILNVSFLVPTLRREFGGVAGNIAYSLAQLGGNPVPLGTIGVDGADYLRRLDTLGIDRSRVLQIDGTHTAQAFITTDLDDNQITAFHPGAMFQAQETTWPGVSPRMCVGPLSHRMDSAPWCSIWKTLRMPAFPRCLTRARVCRSSMRKL